MGLKVRYMAGFMIKKRKEEAIGTGRGVIQRQTLSSH